VTLIDGGEIALADDGGFDVSLSRAATIEMLDNPTNATFAPGSPAVGPTPTNLVSMFQTNSVAFLVSRYVNWQRLQSSPFRT
jgi:hypothetical protein